MNKESALTAWRHAIARMPSDQDWLTRELVDEINDPKFIRYRHGERHTRNKGCRGPLCQKSLRDWQRDRVRRVNEQEGRTTRQHARSPLYVAIDPTLEIMKQLHDKEFDSRTKPVPVMNRDMLKPILMRQKVSA